MMKRFHVHVAVDDLAASIRFYSTLFGAEPTVRKPDYAKWMVDDPRINFAISVRGARVGVNHLGLEVDSNEELEAMRVQLAKADPTLVEESNAHCCYAKSDKYWITDPQGIAWETYHSLGSIPIFGSDAREEAPTTSACCAPAATTCGATVANDARSGCCA
jgi:catechol 2,3-dioxygenase-like lactoylglutathione lyase family enzyme